MHRYDELGALRERIRRGPVPALVVPAAVEDAIAQSVRYLGSDDALQSLDGDTYWPKWNSPWWHMLLLHELGEARQIPARTAAAMAAGLAALPLKSFPIHPGELPPGVDPYRGVSCHCALGNMYQVLTACGLDVDAALPWIEPWFRRYQLPDGGLNCDETAYLAVGQCPSSMVATIAPLETMLARRPDAWTDDQRAFLDRGAGFLIARQLRHGSPTVHNAAERAREPAWLQTCFPRFYFYDVLRGLSALVRWAEATAASVPLRAVDTVVNHLLAAAPDGVVRLERRAYDGVTTLGRSAAGDWIRRQPASSFALLDAASTVGEPSAPATRQWTATRAALLRLIDAGRLVADVE